MTKKLLLILPLLLTLYSIAYSQDCTIDITLPTSDTTICLGDSIYLRSEGSCDVFLNNGFEGGIGVGWSSTAANPTFPNFGCDETCTWATPGDCQEYRFGDGPNGQYLWVGATNSLERTIVTDSFDVTIGNCYVKFWMRFGRQENNGSGDCEDPENVGSFYGAGDGEGVHLQYSIDDGASWTDFPGINQFPDGPNLAMAPFITYVDGSGGYWDPTPTGWVHTSERYDTSNVYWWHEYSCPVPPPAETTTTRFRFAQLNTDQLGYDTWGIDEVKIFCSNNQNVIWGHGPAVFNPVDPVSPIDTTQYWVMVFDTVGNFDTDTVTIFVAHTPVIDLGPDTTICWDGTNTAYFDAGAGFAAYLWNTGDTTQVLTPDTTGTYIVQVWNATCYDTDTIHLTSIPATVANAGSDESVCQGDEWNFHSSANPPTVLSADSIEWFGGIGSFSDPTDTIPIYYTDPGEIGPVMLGMIAYGSGPCGNDTNYMTLTVDTVPTIDFTTDPIDTACFLANIVFTGISDVNIDSWHWDFGDGSTASGQVANYAYPTPGTYTIQLSVVSDSGCVDTIIYSRVITDPYFYFTHVPDSSCQNDTVYFDGQGDMVTYADWIWDFGDGSPADTGRNVTHVYPNNGVYSVTLSVCNQDTILVHNVMETAVANAGSDEVVCEYHSFDFSTSVVTPDTVSGDSLLWYGGLGTFNDASLLWPTYTPAAGEIGDILMTLVVYGKGTCINDTSTMILSVLDGPEAGFTYIPNDSICVGEEIVFTDTSTTTIVNWVWDFGDGNIGSGSTITHTYTSDGIYNVKLIVTNDTNCVDSITIPVEVHILPDADFIISPNDSVCLNAPMNFDASSTTTITSWDWDMGDGTLLSGQNVAHTYATPGSYDVYLYVENDNSCTDTVMYPVFINTLPTCDFTMSPNDTNCVNEEVFFFGTGSADVLNWEWDFGDGNTATGQNVSHTYAADGPWDIMLVVSNITGCTDTTIYTREVIDINIDFTISPSPSCLGDPITVNGTGDIVEFTDWIWDFGDGNTGIGRDVVHLYSTYDTFDITLIVCSDTIIYQHIVLQPANADAGSDEGICEGYSFNSGGSVIPPSAVSYDSIRWYGGLGTFNDPTLLQPIYMHAGGEIGTITLTMVAYGKLPCSNDTSTMELTISDSPEASIATTPPDSLCVDEWIIFDGSSSTTINNWDWDLGDGNTATGQSVGYSYNTAGTYTVTLFAVNTGACADTVTHVVEIHELPVADFNILPNDSICRFEELTFDATSTTNIESWNWDFGDGNNGNGQTTTHSFIAAGTYDVYLYVYNENSCTDTVLKQVTIYELPVADFSMSPNDTNCINEEVFFDATGTADIVAWDWDFDDGNNASGQNVSHSFAGPGTYDVMLVVTNGNGCYDTTIHQRVVMDINIDFTITPSPSCLGDPIAFNGTGDIVEFTDWIWDFGDGNTGIGRDVFHLYATYDTFDITLIVCSDTIIHSHIIQEPAFADAGSDESICEYYSFDFTTATTLATATAYDSLRWFGGLGTFNDPTLLHPVYTPAAGELGTVQLSLISLARIPCENDTSTMTLTIFDGPEADFTITPPDSICVGESISLDATSTTTITSWDWDFGDGNTGNGQNITYTWSAAGIYNIRLVVTNSDICYDTVVYSIEVFELPVADFIVSPGNAICTNEELTFSGSSSTNILNWHWDFGDGNTATGQNTTHTYTNFGTYNVSLMVYNENSCRDTMTQVVTIFELPSCDFTISPNDSSCVNELITFNGTGTADIISWDWDFGDGNISAGQVVTHVYTNPGTYNVMLVVANANGCLDTMIHQRVVVEPVIDFTMTPSPSCEGYVVDFTAIGLYDFTDYVWDFGDGFTGMGRNVTHTFTTPNTYTITLTFCTSQEQYDLLVNPLPTAFAGQDTTSCEDVPFDISTLPIPPAATNYSSLMWIGGIGTFDDPTQLAPIYTPAPGELGFITLSLVAYGIAPCYNDTSSMTIEVIEGAYAFAGSDENSCQGDAFNFANSAVPPAAYNELNRIWSGGAGFFVDPTAEVPIYIPDPLETGPITLTFIATNVLNCDSLDEMILHIHPVYEFTQNHTICFNDTLTLPGGGWANTTGIYYDTLQSVWGCDSVIITDLFVYPKIDADFSIAPRDSVCIDDLFTFTRTGTANLTSWQWDFGDGNFSNVLNPTHSYPSPGVYHVTFSYVDDLGCTDEVTHDVFVYNPPDLDFNSSASSACLNSAISFFGISSDNIISWDWDFGDGGTGSGQNVSHVYSTYGAMQVTVYVEASNGCQTSLTKPIFVAEPPNADFTYNILSCDTIQFTDLSTCPAGYFIVAWDWDFDDGNFSNLQNPAHPYATGGIYDVKLVITSDSSGMLCYDSLTMPIVGPDRPTVYFTWSPEPTCLGDPMQFFGNSGNPITEWYWDFDDGNFAYSQNVTHTYLDTGTYNVLLLAKDINGCWDTITHDVTVVGVPDVSFSINPNPGCAGEQISFNGSSTTNISTWLWDFGDGGQSIDQNPQHVYATAGTYTVTLWVADSNNCFNSTTQSVVINPMPLPDFTHSGVTCSGDTIFFYNQSVSPNGTIIEWVWDFGDGNSVTIAAPDDPDVFHIYAGGGNFNVTLTVLDIDSCSNSVTKPVSITAGPIADFNYEPNCDGQPVVFTDISSPNSGSVIVSWYWEFDDPASGNLNTSTLQNPTHLFTSPGTFDVLLLVENVEGCTDTIVSPVNVNEAPSVSFTTDSDSACVDTDMNFYGNANTGVSWTWDFGDGGTSVLQDPVHVYAAPGTYLVTVTVEDGNACTATYSSNVYVNPLPIADFAFSALPCSGIAVDFSDLSSPMNAYMLSWHWYFGDGNDTILFAPGPGDISHIYDSPGAYTVSLAIENSNGCKDSITYDVSVIQGPLADFEHSGDVCQGGNVQFTDLSQGLGGVVQTWFWQFGDPNSGSNNTSALQNPTHVYSQSGTYVVSLTVTTNNGCQNTAVDTLEIAPPPSLDWFNSPDTICHGSLAYFFTDPDTTHIAEVVSFAWNFGDPASGTNDTSNLQNPVHMFTAPGVYTVTMSITNIDGCTNTRIYNIEVNRPPVADFDYEQACLNDSTLFTDMSISQTATITSWLWDFGDPGSGAMNTSTLQNTGHVFSSLGTYNVQLISTDIMGCSDTIVKTLVVDLAPTAYFDYVQPCEPPGFVFFNDSSWWQPGAAPIVEWLWEIEPGYFSSEINPTYTFTEYDSCYVVHLTVTDANGCENHYTDSVCVVPPLEGAFQGTRVCNGDSTFFTSSYAPIEDSILSYKWEMGDGNIILGTADSLYYTYTDPGTYYVTLTMLNQNGCEKSFLQEIIVDALPEVDFSFTPTLCDDITSFTDLTDPGAGATISSWLWNFGDTASDDNTSELPNPQHQYPAIDSTYVVSLIITNSHGCVDSTEYILEKGLCMQAVFEVSTTSVCRNTEVCFTDSSYVLGDSYDIHTWQWEMGDGQVYEYNFFQDSICHSYTQWGSYQVMLVVSTTIGADQYSDTTYRMVEVSAEPEAEMIVQAPCAENLTSFFDISDDNGVEITTWQWSFGDPNNANDTSSLQNPIWIYNQTGDYTVELIVENENGCTDTITDEIQVFDNPEAAFSSSLACVGGMTQFTDESTPTEADLSQWLWSFGTGESSGVQNARYVYADTGSYLVEMVVTDENLCRDTTQQMVSVYTVPLSEFEIVDNYESIQGQILLDNFTEGAVRYVWEFGNGDTSQMFSPVVRYEENGTYTIQLISWNENNCPDTALMEYTIEFQGLYVPTGFSPASSDPVMKEFKPVGLNLESYELVIINQRGNVVFRSHKLDENGSPLEGWDGTTDGEPQPTGNYMWSISAKFQDGSIWLGNDVGDGKQVKTFGMVVLIR